MTQDNNQVEQWFSHLADHACTAIEASDVLLLDYAGERSDFVRFNNSAVRQPGSVSQHEMTVRIIRGQREATSHLALSGITEFDTSALTTAVGELSTAVQSAPIDPYTAYNETPHNTRSVRRGLLPPKDELIDSICDVGKGRDLVGFYAAGTQMRGFANSLGQRNWHEIDTFNFDWSFYHHTDKAVKLSYAGTEWNRDRLQSIADTGASQLEIIKHPPVTREAGHYRVYLAPAALEEIVKLLGWGGFSASNLETGQSPLQRMRDEAAELNPRIDILENAEAGVSPRFQHDGFMRPAQIEFIKKGRWQQPLVSPRTAREFSLEPNGADSSESPQALEIGGGDLQSDEIYRELGTGIFVTNLWYANFSDRYAGRITGMTRFASHWVEDGQPVGPINPLRFDDTVLDLLGKNLINLTVDRDFLMDPGTYGARSDRSARLPGALIEPMTFTL